MKYHIQYTLSFCSQQGTKKPTLLRDLYKLLKEKFRANKLIKNPLKDGTLLQL